MYQCIIIQMKILNGAELRDFIKERQAKQVRALRQSWKVFPKLKIFYSSNSPVIQTYMRLKTQYGEDILIDVEKEYVPIDNLKERIENANRDESIHGIIVQLPIEDSSSKVTTEYVTKDILSLISPEKDVDGLSSDKFSPATPTAINWLLAGYNIDLSNKKIAIIGQGILVGRPLAKIWQGSNLDISTFDKETTETMKNELNQFDIIVSAAGVPGLITSQMLKLNAVVVDAGTTSEHGEIKGDVSIEVRKNRNDLTITPKTGGVGPLTVAALMDNVIIAARKVANEKGQQDL